MKKKVNKIFGDGQSLKKMYRFKGMVWESHKKMKVNPDTNTFTSIF